jgi:hypothetical protein
MTNAAFNKKAAFQQQIALICKDKTIECHVWSTALYGAGAQFCLVLNRTLRKVG